MKLLALILNLVIIISNCCGQLNDRPKRDSFKLNITVDEGNFYSTDVKASSFILPKNTVQFYSGETLFVEVEIMGNEVKSMKSVKENLNPEKTLIISLTQQIEAKKHRGMILKIVNPFNKKIDYKANAFLMKTNKWAPTNVLPVQAKLSAVETWPDIVITLALSGWEFK